MKTRDRCLQFTENISDTAERLMVGSQFNRIPADQVARELQNIIRQCEYLNDSLDQESQD